MNFLTAPLVLKKFKIVRMKIAGNFKRDLADILSINLTGIEEKRETENISPSIPHFIDKYGSVKRANTNMINSKPSIVILGRRDHWKILSI